MSSTIPATSSSQLPVATSVKPGSAVNPDGSVDFGANAPLRVVKGSALASVAGFAAGSSTGVWRNQSGTLLGMRMGINCFTFAFPFFALREYVVGPALSSADPYLLTSLPANIAHNTSTTARSPRTRPPDLTHNALASTLSGSVVGAALAGWRRGCVSIPSGAIVFAALCAALQLSGNEARRIVWRWRAPMDLATPIGSALSRHDAGDAPRVDVENFSNIESQVTPELSDQLRKAASDSPSESWLSRLKSGLSAASPVHKISDEEYEGRLRARLVQVEAELKELDVELSSVDRFEWGQQGGEKVL
ncbi:hypothetical protein K437DRAFT_258990 [Tilletiaria anomala UBC 951]|uniref:Uncharacterized protein n=1 Tax=Tilletiaria anomala (strain ATCC 24038 / CBS 436.72 / UBC 951) TaxID=1037660 RepID=A0A066VM02_TILAU|nr:uncharacterized protein K437DRAFT_258990 [Tilletiaria anomala UBC 951]KDN39620.1 hypothetical protein K437DRAFT_258990 [Tilletiaria anomala UBC 951]